MVQNRNETKFFKIRTNKITLCNKVVGKKVNLFRDRREKLQKIKI